MGTTGKYLTVIEGQCPAVRPNIGWTMKSFLNIYIMKIKMMVMMIIIIITSFRDYLNKQRSIFTALSSNKVDISEKDLQRRCRN